jgi:hypothetical protein
MKDNLNYFTHDSDAFEHPKHQALIATYGFEGYGRFWVLNEFISKASGCKLDISKKRNRATIANRLNMSIQDFDNFVDFLADDEECGLLCFEDGHIWTDRTQEDLERVMKNREDAASRRKGSSNISNNSQVDQRYDYESKKLTNESKKLTNENKRAEQSRAEQTRLEQQAGNQPVDNSKTEPGPEEVRAAAAVLNLQLKSGDAAAISRALAGHDLNAAFITWASGELKANSKIKNPAGFLRKMLLLLDEYGDWIARYRASHARPSPPARAAPPGEVCPHCGGALRAIGDEIWCNSCKRLLWEYDGDFDIWSEAAEQVDASGW